MKTITDCQSILNSFGINATCVNIQSSGNYLFCDIKLHPYTRVNDIKKYSDEISLVLKTSKPNLKILHQEGVVRLEFVQSISNRLNLFDYFTNKRLPKGEINILLGQSVDGKRMWMDLSQNPHLLIAGSTGSGKTTVLHNVIANLYNYNHVDLFLIDPKKVEFSEYEKCHNSTVLYSYKESLDLLKNKLKLMEDRYESLRNGESRLNLKPNVIIIDEFADLVMQDKDNHLFDIICRLTQKCRAARIHFILATQRPSVNILNGALKANFPARIACRVASHTDSKVILDTKGAENLIGKGDAIIRDNFRYLERFQVAYTTPQEVCNYFSLVS